MYAIIEEGGRQHKVTAGDRIKIDQLTAGEQKTVTLNKVLLVAGEGAPKIGLPHVAGAKVHCDVIGAMRGPKIDIYKYKRRKGYHKKQGHRQNYVEVRVKSIEV